MSHHGGKADALNSLARAGFPVPPFFVVEDADDPASILASCHSLDPTATRFAVRSSAQDEDSAGHSFAGQFDSFLRVPLAEVPARCLDVITSAMGDRIETYRRASALTDAPTRVYVIVQIMVDAEFAGVAFTADPVTGDRTTTVISATEGTAEHLVSGTEDGDSFRVAEDGTVNGPDAPKTLTEPQASRVAQLARRAESHFGAPQDIEWAMLGGELYLLQSRPITALAPEGSAGGELRIWDNSNIAESYSGITSPLTFTFARRAYASVYRQFCRIMGVPTKRIDAAADVFDNMLGHIRGHVFYNLVNWYRVLALLPGFRTNRKFMEQMMGVKEPMPDEIIAEVEAESSVGKLRDAAHIARTLAGLVWNLARHRGAVVRFHRRLQDTLTELEKPVAEMSPSELVAHYHGLEEKLLTRWDTPLVNDFFAMIFFGVLKKKSEAWLGDTDGSLANRLIRDTGADTSTKPPRLIREMAALARSNSDLGSALEPAASADDLESFPEFHKALTGYLSEFGDRCLSELKLESPTLHDDASPLLQSVRALAGRDESVSVKSEEDVEKITSTLPFFRRHLFKWILKNARGRLRDRENLRFERTRVFARVRSIMRQLGSHYAAADKLKRPDDIFYLSVEEAIGEVAFKEETASTRRAEFKILTGTPPPPDRFETRGDSAFFGGSPPASHGHGTGTTLGGIGASPGIVSGTARVINDPQGARLSPGEILVARQTDPGWVVLFPAAAGIVVERGSLLSHSAIVAREMGIPAVVSLTGATTLIPDGAQVEIDGTTGAVRIILTEQPK